MKKVFVITISVLNIAVISCNSSKAKTINLTTETTQQRSDNQVTFKVDGEQVKSSGWNISRFDMGRNTELNITTNMHEDKRTIMINIKADKVGRYSLNTAGEAYGDYKPDYQELLDSYSFKDGSITITAIDTVLNTLNATFEGTVKNRQGKSFRISDGTITNGRLTPGITKY